MSDLSARLSLPYLAPAQAQKHVTHNEALRLLDLTVQLVLEGLEADVPPALPGEGAVWALGTAPSGAWAGQAGRLAGFVDGGWLFFDAGPGWRGWDRAAGTLRIWDGSTWTATGGGTAPVLQNLPGLGIASTSDATNRLSVTAPATLLTHDGAGHQLKINKSTTADTASLLFQTGWSGRAEMGTSGTDSFAIKVSANGTAWTTALTLDADTGHADGAAVVSGVLDATPGRLLKTGSGGIAGPAAPMSGPGSVTGQTYRSGIYHTTPTMNGLPESGYEQSLFVAHSPTGNGRYAALALRGADTAGSQRLWFGSGADGNGAIHWTQVWHGANTTVDANGFLKQASPIVRLFDTTTEEPVEPVGAQLEKTATGVYVLRDVPALAHRGWQIEVPRDGNGNALVFVDTTYDPALRRLTLRTSVPFWQFEGGWGPGAPRDIPKGRWVDLRFTRR